MDEWKIELEDLNDTEWVRWEDEQDMNCDVTTPVDDWMNSIKPVPRLHDYIEVLMAMFDSKEPVKRCMRVKHAVSVLYVFGDAYLDHRSSFSQDYDIGVEFGVPTM